MDNSIKYNDCFGLASKFISDLISNERGMRFRSKELSEKEKERLFSKKQSKIVLPVTLPFDIQKNTHFIYRSRIAETIGPTESITNPQTFSFIPPELLTDTFPRRGRFNLTGQALLYGSLEFKTNFREMSQSIQNGDFVFTALYEKQDDIPLNCFCINSSYNLENINPKNFPYKEILDKMSQLLLAPNSTYFASSFLANFILFEEASRGYDAIIYPSVRVEQESCSEYNIVITPDFFKRHYELKCVIYGHVDSSLTTGIAKYIGFPNGGSIAWYEFKIYPKGELFYDYEDANGRKITVKKAYSDNIFSKYLSKELNIDSVCKLFNMQKATKNDRWMFLYEGDVSDTISVGDCLFYPRKLTIRCFCTLRLNEMSNPDETILGHVRQD